MHVIPKALYSNAVGWLTAMCVRSGVACQFAVNYGPYRGDIDVEYQVLYMWLCVWGVTIFGSAIVISFSMMTSKDRFISGFRNIVLLHEAGSVIFFLFLSVHLSTACVPFLSEVDVLQLCIWCFEAYRICFVVVNVYLFFAMDSHFNYIDDIGILPGPWEPIFGNMA